jgi:Fic family protein
LRKGYWVFAFLPISIAIKSAPAQYVKAYILSEQDDNDLNYFIDYHLKKINQA